MKGAADMASQDKEQEGPRPGDRTFTQWLHEQRKGGLHADLTVKLAEVIKAASETEKNGTLTLKISVKPTGDGMVVVSDDVTAKVPEPDKGASLFFADSAGNLHRSDPRQMTVPGLHDVKETSTHAG